MFVWWRKALILACHPWPLLVQRKVILHLSHCLTERRCYTCTWFSPKSTLHRTYLKGTQPPVFCSLLSDCYYMQTDCTYLNTTCASWQRAQVNDDEWLPPKSKLWVRIFEGNLVFCLALVMESSLCVWFVKKVPETGCFREASWSVRTPLEQIARHCRRPNVYTPFNVYILLLCYPASTHPRSSVEPHWARET